MTTFRANYSTMEPHNEDILYSQKLKAGKRRTYFFDIKQTRGGDKYITITESKRRDNGNGYDRHKIFVYKEDLTRFRDYVIDLVEEVKNQMPDYDFDEFARRAEERDRLYQEQLAQEKQQAQSTPIVERREVTETRVVETREVTDEVPNITSSTETGETDGTIQEDDLSW